MKKSRRFPSSTSDALKKFLTKTPDRGFRMLVRDLSSITSSTEQSDEGL